MRDTCVKGDAAAEYEELIAPFSPASEKASMREVFGATEEDINRLRIVSLQEVRNAANRRTSLTCRQTYDVASNRSCMPGKPFGFCSAWSSQKDICCAGRPRQAGRAI